jgi:hypothetical protein
MKQLRAVLTLGLIVATAAPLMAQQPTQKDSSKKGASIPADARPPKGMCRIWIDNVPSAQQPAATDFPTAVKNRPSTLGDGVPGGKSVAKIPAGRARGG